MSDFYNLRQVILGCISRAGSSFNTGTQNFADIAVNNAVIYAQRKCDFEWNKGVVQIACNPAGSIMQATDMDGKAVKVKNIIKAFGSTDPGLEGTSIPYLSRVSQITDSTNSRANHCFCAGTKVVHEGQRVYLSPRPENEYNLFFYAVKWLPRLVKDDDTNFLLEYAFDFLMYRAIVELNFFIKEEERFQVTQKMIDDSWQSVIAWDSHLVSPTETEIDL